MTEDSRTQAKGPAHRRPAAPPARSLRGGGINWFRFWMQMLAAMLVFNVLAALVTWFFILPHLHPAP